MVDRASQVNALLRLYDAHAAVVRARDVSVSRLLRPKVEGLRRPHTIIARHLLGGQASWRHVLRTVGSNRHILLLVELCNLLKLVRIDQLIRRLLALFITVRDLHRSFWRLWPQLHLLILIHIHLAEVSELRLADFQRRSNLRAVGLGRHIEVAGQVHVFGGARNER